MKIHSQWSPVEILCLENFSWNFNLIFNYKINLQMSVLFDVKIVEQGKKKCIQIKWKTFLK